MDEASERIVQVGLDHAPESAREILGWLAAFRGPLARREAGFWWAMAALIGHRQGQPVTIVEVGTLRVPGQWTDGQSTLMWSIFLSGYRAHYGQPNIGLHTIDTDATAIRTASCVCRTFASFTNFMQADSLEVLGGFPRIDLLYLDGLDYDKDPQASQLQNLREAQLVQGKMAVGSVIVVDDCDLPGGGKVGLTQPWLEANGWQCLHKDYMAVFQKVEAGG